MESEPESKLSATSIAAIITAVASLLGGIAAILTIFFGHQPTGNQDVPPSAPPHHEAPSHPTTAVKPSTETPSTAASDGMQFRIGAVTSVAGQDAYKTSFSQFLARAIARAGIADQASGASLDASIVDVSAEVVAGVGGNVWNGTAIVALSARNASRTIELKQSCAARGTDRNDASLNALAAVAETLAERLQELAAGRAGGSKCPN